MHHYGKGLDKYKIEQNDYNIKNFLNKMKFNNIESNKYYNSEKKENSMELIMVDGNKFVFLVKIHRSDVYIIDDDDLHEGFKSTRDEILCFIKKYFEKNNIKGNLKLWTKGYSRDVVFSN